MVGVATVGAGAWGKNHIRVFSELPGARLKYVCDSDGSKLSSLQKMYPQVKMVDHVKPILEDSGRPGRRDRILCSLPLCSGQRDVDGRQGRVG